MPVVALCQFEVVSSDRTGNLLRLDQALGEAKSSGAEIAVAPESCVLGWINPESHKLAESRSGVDVQALQSLAIKYGIGLVAGVDILEEGSLYGCAVAIRSDGELIAIHQKSNVLPELMDPPYSPGEKGKATVADFSFARVGILVCADTFDQECIGDLKRKQVDFVAVPYGWVADPGVDTQTHSKKLEKLVCQRAKELEIPIVGVDATGKVAHGPWKDRVYCGASVAAGKNGDVLVRVSGQKTEVVTV